MPLEADNNSSSLMCGLKRGAGEINNSVSVAQSHINASVARSYMEGFTIHGLSKVFTGKLWERLYWFLILAGALGFVIFKVYGFHLNYGKNEFRTEIRMIDT